MRRAATTALAACFRAWRRTLTIASADSASAPDADRLHACPDLLQQGLNDCVATVAQLTVDTAARRARLPCSASVGSPCLSASSVSPDRRRHAHLRRRPVSLCAFTSLPCTHLQQRLRVSSTRQTMTATISIGYQHIIDLEWPLSSVSRRRETLSSHQGSTHQPGRVHADVLRTIAVKTLSAARPVLETPMAITIATYRLQPNPGSNERTIARSIAGEPTTIAIEAKPIAAPYH